MRFGWGRQVTVQRWGSTWGSCRGERLSSVDGRLRETLTHPSPPNPQLFNYPSIQRLFHPLSLLMRPSRVWNVASCTSSYTLPQIQSSVARDVQSDLIGFSTKKMKYSNSGNIHSWLFFGIFCHYVAGEWRLSVIIKEHTLVFFLCCQYRSFLHHPVLFTFLTKLYSLNGPNVNPNKLSSSLTLSHWWQITMKALKNWWGIASGLAQSH